MNDFTKISHLIEEQFPALYRKEGETLVSFVEAYYDWLEQSNQVNDSAFNLPAYLDIDTTVDKFLSHFRETYMVGLPSSLIGNQRLLQKHILDLYRSKNSKTSLELLFRLLFNKSIEVYIPSTDMFRLSDGKYQRTKYIEVDYTKDLRQYLDSSIVGAVSGATAYVVGIERQIIKNIPRYRLFIEDVKGTFLVSEALYDDGNMAQTYDVTRILGSVDSIDIDVSLPGWTVGEEVFIQEEMTPVDGERMKGFVAETFDSDTGMIFPVITKGGTGFSMNAVITVTDFENTQGIDAAFAVGALSNTSVITVTNLKVSDFMGLTINNPDYGFSENTEYNETYTTAIELVALYKDITVGTIAAIRTLNPGRDYDGRVQIDVIEPRTYELGWLEADGSLFGDNAVIDNYAAFGSKLVSKVVIRDSGVGYNGGRTNVYIIDKNNLKFASGTLNFGAVGTSEGRFLNSDGMLSSTKRLQDSYYYQEYSYEVRVSESLSRYADVVKAVVHPSGNELFGSVKVVEDSGTDVAIDTLVEVDPTQIIVPALPDGYRYVISNDTYVLDYRGRYVTMQFP